MAQILILDGHCSAALAFTRSLGRAGNRVVVAVDEGRFAAAAHSRYCRALLFCPSPTQDEGAFAAWVLNAARREDVDLVVPMTDWTSLPLAKRRQQFPPSCRLAAPDAEAVQLAADKYKVVQIADSVGVPVPRTVLVSSCNELSQLDNISFPAVVKDRFSLRWLGNRGVSGSVAYAYSRDGLERLVKQRLGLAGDVLVQEFVPGSGVGFSCFASDENLYLPFQWKRLRETDPRGSGSSARKSVALRAEVLRYSRQLISRIGFQGIAMVEFKQDFRTGKFVLMEVNGRPWGSIQLPVYCGIDYPGYVTRWYLEGVLPPAKIDYREGITCRLLVGDLTHLKNVLAGKPAGWPLPYPGVFSTLLKIAMPWYPGLRYDDLAWGDMRPGFAALTHWLRREMRARVSASKPAATVET